VANPTPPLLLTRAQMRWLSGCFPLSHGILRVDHHRELSGIIHIIRHGLQWRDAPPAYGPPRRSTIASSAEAAWVCSTASSQP
jgi:transposase